MRKLVLSRSVLAACAAVFVFGVVFVACQGGSTPTAPEPPLAAAAPSVASLASPVEGDVAQPPQDASQVEVIAAAAHGGVCSGKKTAICHLPPGDPANIQEICVSPNAVPGHFAHGDFSPLTFWPDADGDGFGDSSAPGESGCVVPPGFVEDNTDCDDSDAAVNPDAAEILCDAIDNNCNGDADDDVNADGDPVSFCDGDCDDDDATIYPGADEVLCDSIDQNCNGSADDDVNADGDPVTFCDGDCDDDDATIYPGADEVLCDSIDQNCNGAADDDVNADGDPVSFCDGDCDDDEAESYPGNTEVCDDSIDNDCDGETDGDDSECNVNTAPVAEDDDFVLTPTACILPTCSGDRTCTLNAPADTITSNDSDAEGHTFDAMIDGNITDAGWTCNADHLCTTDSGFNAVESTLTVNADGSFTLFYRTTQNFIFGGQGDIVIAEFLYNIQEDSTPEMLQSASPARVMIPVYTNQSCP